jgi:hypothetical protein
VAGCHSTAGENTVMTTRDILQTDIAELVPAAGSSARKLPKRETMPRNTVPLGLAAADALGIQSLPDDPSQIERLIDRARK